ncbi:MAG TPA: integrase core domain-containing protein, partial [Sphingobacteriaceae bacterium]
NIAISMTENGDPYENALAERVNGIIKSEFSLYHSLLGLEQTGKKISESIEAYNTIRPHLSCDFLTPEVAHLQTGVLKKQWKSRNYKVNEKELV